jgi:hypothetical protein
MKREERLKERKKNLGKGWFRNEQKRRNEKKIAE